jgi:hypothetical protein
MSFKRLDPEDITISAEAIVAPAWSNQGLILEAGGVAGFYTSSDQVSIGAGNYYYDIYQTASNATGADVQFSIAYGNRVGSGSTPINGAVTSKTPSAVTYGQYRTLINGDENTDFNFAGTIPNSIYVISVERSKYKENLLPGSLTLTLVSGSNTLKLTDDSLVNTTVTYVDAGRVYNLISGSAGTINTSLTTTGYTTNSGSYGKFLPDVGVIILNGEALKAPSGSGGLQMTTLNEGSGINSQINLRAFYNILNTAGSSFRLQSEETVTSNYVFVRVRNSEFNYSTNPSIITGSGELRYDVLVNTPQAYITTVGMYNDTNDLLAVAKLSKPLLKDFTKEALIRIKLDY